MLAEPDLVVRLRRHAALVTPVFRRFVPLHRALEAAAASEPSAADMVAEFDAGRLDASTHYAKAAKKTGRSPCPQPNAATSSRHTRRHAVAPARLRRRLERQTIRRVSR